MSCDCCPVGTNQLVPGTADAEEGVEGGQQHSLTLNVLRSGRRCRRAECLWCSAGGEQQAIDEEMGSWYRPSSGSGQEDMAQGDAEAGRGVRDTRPDLCSEDKHLCRLPAVTKPGSGGLNSENRVFCLYRGGVQLKPNAFPWAVGLRKAPLSPWPLLCLPLNTRCGRVSSTHP